LKLTDIQEARYYKAWTVDQVYKKYKEIYDHAREAERQRRYQSNDTMISDVEPPRDYYGVRQTKLYFVIVNANKQTAVDAAKKILDSYQVPYHQISAHEDIDEEGVWFVTAFYGQ